MRRVLKWLGLAAVFVIVAALAGVWWVTSSPSALQWLIAEAEKATGGRLAFEGVSGSLLGRVHVQRLTFATDSLKLRLDDVSLQLGREALLQRRVEVVDMAVAAMDVETVPSDKPLQPPETLTLPVEFEVREAHIARAQVSGQHLSNIAFGYRGGSGGQALRNVAVDTEWGRLHGDLQVAGAAPFALSAQLKFDYSRQGEQAQAQATVGGNLLNVQVTARGTMRGAVVDAQGRIAPFEPVWLRAFSARGEAIEITRFVPDAPAAVLQVSLSGAGTAAGWPSGSFSIVNTTPGEISAKRLPLTTLSANYAMSAPTTVAFTDMAAGLGAVTNSNGGTVTGSAQVSPSAVALDLALRNLDLHALHAPLRATRLNGSLKAGISGDVQRAEINVADHGLSLKASGERRGDVITVAAFRAQAGAGTVAGSGELTLSGAQPYRVQATLAGLDPAAFGNYPKAAINGRVSAHGALAPQWQADLALTLTRTLYRGVPFTGAAAGLLSSQGVRKLRLDLAAAGSSAHAEGNYGRAGDALTFRVDVPQLARLSQLIPAVADIEGQVNATGRLQGSITQPQFEMEANGKGLLLPNKLHAASVRVQASGALNHHTLHVAARDRDYDLDAQADGGWDAARGWSGRLASLRNAGTYPLQLSAPMPMAFARGRFSAGPAQATMAGGRFDLATLESQGGRLTTKGSLASLPLAPLLALAGTPAPQTTLRINGTWAISTSPGLTGQVTLTRESGDLVTPGDTALALGLDRLSLDARLANGALDATLDVAAQVLKGHAHATLASLSPEAALKLNGQFDVASLRVLDPLLGTAAFVRGRASLTVEGGGSLAAPQLTGSLTATDLAVQAPQYGIQLRDGRLQAELNNQALVLKELLLHGEEGTLSATGSMSRGNSGATSLAWRVDHLRLLNRPEMRLKIDGSGTTALVDKKLVLRGALTADEGYFQFDTPRAPTLASDIVVVGRPRQPPRGGMKTSFQTAAVDADVTLDAGRQFRVVGAGLDTILRGKVNIKSTAAGALDAHGVLSSVNGIYYAFGQRLEIERGRLIFNGPLDNPALDIVAKRRNLEVEPGVEVTGSVRVPNIRLVSDPPVADSEKLAWLTLGHGLETASATDVVLLQAAAQALVGKGGAVPVTQRIANRLGLDDLSLKGNGTTGGQVAAVGKRLSERLYLEYQQGVAATSSVLRLSYSLTRSLSLRLEAGLVSSLGVYFTRSYK